ncbi:MAG: PKD domain-containing protein [Lewinellaceae bacterium]|nr:PKD domain-containing protein [Lewinellaceae bacterium]
MNNLLCCFSLLIFSLEASTAAAQTTPISDIVNQYTAVTGIDTCTGKLSVSDTAGFRPGGAILLIQMQGAEISSANNFLYGIVQNMNYAGRFERAVIDSVALNAIFVQKKLVYAYDIAGKLQAVTLPQYNDAAVNDTLRCQPWNGSTGGILALEASGTLTLDAPVLADGAGFRGGAAYTAPTNSCNFLFPETAYFYAFGNWRGSYKGEGIALPIAGKEFGRGPQANGGGGGNDHNSGGGGGANIADGGNGGDNDEPGSLGCDGYYPGVRGYGIFFTPGRLFPGGGGGAGHSNNALTSAGGHGGGIIFIQAGDIAGNAPVISANGLSAPNTNGDGAGGGGAGGTIWLNAGSAPANLVVSANGGNGGNTLNNNQNRCFGPGGGGSGGRILSNLFGINSPSGGQAGLVANSTNSCNGTSNGATGGDAGFSENTFAVPEGDTEYLLPQILANPTSYTACSGKPAFFSLQSNTGNWGFQWQVNDGTGWQNITGGNYAGFTTDSLVINNTALAQDGLRFRCLVQKSGCTDLISGESTLTVIPAPSAGFSASINGYVADFSNQSAASSFYWQFGDGGVSLANSPQHTYTAEGTYTVTLYAFLCPIP